MFSKTYNIYNNNINHKIKLLVPYNSPKYKASIIIGYYGY